MYPYLPEGTYIYIICQKQKTKNPYADANPLYFEGVKGFKNKSTTDTEASDSEEFVRG